VATPSYDREYWEQLWARTLRERAADVALRPPSSYLTAEAVGLAPGRALDAGCGHGSETLWLAARGWEVTAVDFSVAALAHARASAEVADVAERVEWVEADLGSWTPKPDAYDLVVCLYVHIAGPVSELVGRMAAGVVAGGTLLMVGHLPVDPVTGDPTPAAGQVQVSVDDVVSTLDRNEWEFVIAENRQRSVASSGADAVVRAHRLR
jgi:SAM-dependent methyltransferase